MTNKPHFNAMLGEMRSDQEAAPFLFGYLMSDIGDERFCEALAALKRHREELAAIRAEPAPYDPRD